MMGNLKRLVRNFFGFSRTQTYGFVVMVPLIIAILFIPNIYRGLTQIEYEKFDTDKAQLDSLVALWRSNVKTKVENESSRKIEIGLRTFNPNTVSPEEMMGVGIDQRLASRIDNYRNAGGSFKIKADLKKIYGFPDSLYQVLERYIMLPEDYPEYERRVNVPKATLPNSSAESADHREKDKVANDPIAEFLILDINEADSTDFQKLRGIGPTYSSRIVKFKQLLGGFSRIDQIKEVFGVSDSLYQTLAAHLMVDEEFKPEQIKINLATFKELNAHPYISFEQTKEIMNAKSKFGKFKSPADLKRLTLFDSIQIIKLTPYLQFQ
ncbi:helix-hairpin-helix domain-containing protein [Roseivirga echinicomitans]